MALFASPASSSRSSSKNLVEFRAGRMFMEAKMVKPDKRKGLVYVHQSDDGLMHFCWKDRTNGKVEDDLIIFPDDCEFKKVDQNTTGRVYILKFKASSRKFFFWMQEPKTDKDDDHCKKINDSLNSPPTPGSSSANDLPGQDQLAQANLQDMLQNMDNNQLLQLMAGGGGMGGLSSLLGAAAGGGGGGRSRQPRSQNSTSSRTTARPATTTAVPDRVTARARVPPAPAAVTPSPAVVTPAPGAVTPSPVTTAKPTAADSATSGLQLSQLQNILSDMGMQTGAASGGEEPVDLSKAVTSDVMIPILANPEVQQRLKPFLPQGESLPPTAEELKATVKSPQFRQAMSSFSDALATGQLGPVLKQFGLPESALDAAGKGDVEGFAKAMQENEAKSDAKKKKEDTEEEDMVVE